MPRRTHPILILASASPRRCQLLRNAGYTFTIEPAHVDESVHRGERPLAYAKRVGREKSRVVHQKRPHDFVLGADTVVVAGNAMLLKPESARDAHRMLRLLSGRAHQVITAVCLIGPKPNGEIFEDLRAETTRVFVRKLSEKEIADYIATGEPMDKAGAYAIQGRASRWIPKIVGDYSNVVGLPVALVSEMLRAHGFRT
ncbi:MAG TPA: Maf family protein [Terriglobales bacterium]|nr:Maf family protein [Terriglobales bacterium]